MANLLPKEIQMHGAQHERARLIIAGSLAAIAAAALSLLMFVPAYIAVQIGTGAQGNAPSASDAKHTANVTAELSGAQAVLNAIAPLMSATTTPTEAIAAALALQPSGVSIDQIAYAPGSLMLSGVAASDTAIDAYRSALAKDSHFTNVLVPVSALLSAAGGRFSINISGAF